MAETAEETRRSDEEREGERPPPGHGNRIVWSVLVALVVIFFVLGAVAGKKATKPPPSTINQGTRAVIVPTDDAARTVVVPPCRTGTTVASPNAAALENTTGATSVALPTGQGTRVVLVPRCGAGRGASSGTSNLPSALFVTKPGTPVPRVKPGTNGSGPPRAADPASAQFQLTVTPGSSVRTVVVPPCQAAKPIGPAERILGPAPGAPATAVAPSC